LDTVSRGLKWVGIDMGGGEDNHDLNETMSPHYMAYECLALRKLDLFREHDALIWMHGDACLHVACIAAANR
jgi:hypothetical protein